MILPETLAQRLTRTLEEQLYQELLKYGLIPNRDNYIDNPDGYKAKQRDIQIRKGFCVDLFGHGSSADRDQNYVPRIVLTGLGFIAGSLGNDLTPHYELNSNGLYDKKVGPMRSSMFRFEVSLISAKSSQDFALEAIRSAALPNLANIPFYDDAESTFLINYIQMRNEPDFAYGLIKRKYTYEVSDVFEATSAVIDEIPKIKEVEVGVIVDKDPKETLIDQIKLNID